VELVRLVGPSPTSPSRGMGGGLSGNKPGRKDRQGHEPHDTMFGMGRGVYRWRLCVEWVLLWNLGRPGATNDAKKKKRTERYQSSFGVETYGTLEKLDPTTH